MKRTPPVILAAFALCLNVSAEPVSLATKCPACHGLRKVSLTPPNLGQYDGEIGVTPGKPFSTHRWDIKHDPCPLCDGKGWHKVYKTSVKAPKPEDVEGLDKCPTCRWAGVVPCKKCLKSGYQVCSTCKSSSKGGKPGWIKTETGSTKHKKIVVTPCTTCQGLAKVVCPDCLSTGALPCPKCHGEGGTPVKEKH